MCHGHYFTFIDYSKMMKYPGKIIGISLKPVSSYFSSQQARLIRGTFDIRKQLAAGEVAHTILKFEWQENVRLWHVD